MLYKAVDISFLVKVMRMAHWLGSRTATFTKSEGSRQFPVFSSIGIVRTLAMTAPEIFINIKRGLY